MNVDIESNNQQLMKSKVTLLNKAQIALDALPTKDQEKATHVINCLEEFPNCATVETHKLKFIPNYFIARAGVKYRIIFQFQDQEVTIFDIVNHDRLERLYRNLKVSQMIDWFWKIDDFKIPLYLILFLVVRI